jgi:hypothetical protein
MSMILPRTFARYIWISFQAAFAELVEDRRHLRIPVEIEVLRPFVGDPAEHARCERAHRSGHVRIRDHRARPLGGERLHAMPRRALCGEKVEHAALVRSVERDLGQVIRCFYCADGLGRKSRGTVRARAVEAGVAHEALRRVEHEPALLEHAQVPANRPRVDLAPQLLLEHLEVRVRVVEIEPAAQCGIRRDRRMALRVRVEVRPRASTCPSPTTWEARGQRLLRLDGNW